MVNAWPHGSDWWDAPRRHPAAAEGREAQAGFILGKDCDRRPGRIAGVCLGAQPGEGRRQRLDGLRTCFSWDGRGRFGWARRALRTNAYTLAYDHCPGDCSAHQGRRCPERGKPVGVCHGALRAGRAVSVRRRDRVGWGTWYRRACSSPPTGSAANQAAPLCRWTRTGAATAVRCRAGPLATREKAGKRCRVFLSGSSGLRRTSAAALAVMMGICLCIWGLLPLLRSARRPGGCRVSD